MDVRYEILGGPERGTIFTAYEYVYDKDVQVTMKFAAQTPSAKGTAIEVTELYNLSHEDGSGRRLNLEGRCFAHGVHGIKFRMFYDTVDHTGYAILTRPE
ncbi:MAG: hypothetical protein K5837_00280 [Candidatus Saccharibacteria bacterium]|nr:hypothetical protein [Candidatus Saccharibacteria bacterium]